MKRSALAALALLPLLAACGSPGGHGRPAGAAGGGSALPAVPAGTAPSTGTASGASSGPASPGAAGAPRNTRPDGPAAPAAGSFTKKEKKYLAGRVPRGTDPAAILQSGQDTCDRLAYTVRIDRDAAVGAVIAGDVKGAQAAVDSLCPDLKPVVAATRGGYADGTHASPAPGTYRALTPSADCSWSLDGTSGSGHTLTVRKGTRTFTSTGCYAWART
ncbi:hypothetical protein [Streptomyces tropicalis]|uniref:Serine/threonine protein kinase n=1 Tax=Streptomyces tropicalis TaxID=3034234 RepID=A0ABT6ADG7_9ACTN|nr:hypothetical protein [Streptomyces tropicalis]MDF3302695.1 hypothetical protein [Streptomyces tropicalis]